MTEETVSDIVAVRIRQLRKARGWDTTELAARCGGDVTDNVIENIESGRRQDGKRRRAITVDEVFAIAGAFGVEPVELMPLGTPAAPIRLTPELVDQLSEALTTVRSLQAWRAEHEGGE